MTPQFTQLKSRARPPLATATWPLVRPIRSFIERSRDGSLLSPGITAVVAARNEAYTILLCLRSLVGVADQIVCIDNGSDDGTLNKMESFKEEYGDQVEVEIVTMPEALLAECREEGLRRTRRQWHLLWAGDMVATTSGSRDIRELRERVLANDRPRTIQIPRINLYGDLRHTYRLAPVVDSGEPFLMRFGRGMRYREFGRFDAARAPLYYAQEREPKPYIFHLAGLKSDENSMHRFHYFAWRETVNREGTSLDPELRTLEGFTRRRNLELFATTDRRSLKFRNQRLVQYLLVPYDPDRYGDYPDLLKEELAQPQRFEVVYRNGRPWTRIDHEDTEMAGYEPTADDLEWDPEAFLRGLLTEEQCRLVGIAPTN